MNPRRAWPLVLLAVLLAAAAVLRLGSLQFSYGHPDEVIAVGVAESLVQRGSLDTNWELAPLPGEFRYPQYNFSAYLLAAAGALQARAWWPADVPAALEWLRGFSALLGVVVVGLTYALARAWFGAAVGISAALLAAVHPLLYQDSLYARPETFTTVLTLLVLLLIGTPRRPPGARRAFAAAVLAGVLTATKVSMLLLLPLLLLAADWRQVGAASTARERLRVLWPMVRVLPLGVLLGFALGAPYAFAHPGDFLQGVLYLHHQYNAGHWPHGLHTGSFFERLGYAGRYFHGTTGWLLLVAFAGAAVAATRREWRPLAVLALAVVTALQFATYRAFFERNLSHVTPVFLAFAGYAIVALAGLLRQAPARGAVFVGLLAVAALPAASTSYVLRWRELPGEHARQLVALRAEVERRTGLTAIRTGWTNQWDGWRRDLAYRCGPTLLEVPNAGESGGIRDALVDWNKFREVARFTGGFPDVPTSTLHTYFTPPTVFLYRGLAVETCASAGGGFIPAQQVGEPFPLQEVHAEPGWARGAAFGVTTDPFGSPDFYGSWTGSDAARGRVRLVAEVNGARLVVLPMRTGPQPANQSITLRDADTGRVLLTVNPLRRADDWQLPMLRIPANTRAIVLEANDSGAGWGEWQAVGRPRRLVKEPALPPDPVVRPARRAASSTRPAAAP